MTRLRHNVIANFLGSGWTALIGVLLVPVYIRLLGAESYGLIGLYVSLQGLVYVLDAGLSATLNRELARHANTGMNADVSRDLVHTLERVFWPLCLLAAFAMAALSHAIATHWLQPVELSQSRVAHALLLMGVAVAAQWPAAFYAGGLNGLERQVSVNLVAATFATLRWVGVLPVLLQVAGTIEVFLQWQIGVALAQTIATRFLLLQALPEGHEKRRFQRDALAQVSAFALGMFATSAVAFVLIQIDRIVLSRALPLDEFARYMLAATAAAALTRAFQPFFIALYPRYTGLAAAGEHARLSQLYHHSTQYLAVAVSATAMVLTLFAHDVLLIWTGDALIAAEATPILRILVIAAALNGLMNLPYALQLAHGWTQLALGVNLTILPLAIFAAWRMAESYGGVGAAYVWLGVNLVFVCVGVPLMHSRLLRKELGRWYLRDVLPPFVVALVVAALFRSALPSLDRDLAGVFTLALVGVTTLVATALAVPATREALAGLFSRRTTA